MVTLYVGGLPPHMTEAVLAELFGEFGELPQVRLVTGQDGQCRGFAYVTFASDLSAARARVGLDGRLLDSGSILRVAKAN